LKPRLIIYIVLTFSPSILEFETVEEFLEEIKKEFREEDKELKELEQGKQNIEEFIQMFKKAVKDNSYKERLLIEEFKKEIDRTIRRRLVETEYPSKSINQWYERVVMLDRNCRESKRKKKEVR